MKTAWFDCFSGISGDMCLGALLDAGASFENLKRGLKKLPLKGYRISQGRVMRAGIEATKVDVTLGRQSRPASPSPMKWRDVKGIVEGSPLPDNIKKRGLRVLRSIFEAEAKVHGGRVESIHLHELGSVDTLVDVMGTIICLDDLGVGEVCTSAVNVGGGTVKGEHGVLPVPAPATAELLKGVPQYSSGAGIELTTPTGAAIVKGVSSSSGPMPPMTVDSIGYGAGSHDPGGRPNVLRVFIGRADKARKHEEITLIEANIDDMDPRLYGHVIERLLKEGALDAFLTQVIMKKGRPGVLLTVLCPDEKLPRLKETVFRETTTIGLRFRRVHREVLERRIKAVDTEFGRIRFKEVSLQGRVLRSMPEYEDARKAAKRHGVPLLEVMRKIQDRPKR